MSRTPILLLYGVHGVRHQPIDPGFFRTHAAPFIRKHALGEGRKGFWIRESALSPENLLLMLSVEALDKFLSGDPMARVHLQDRLDHVRGFVNLHLLRTVGAGLHDLSVQEYRLITAAARSSSRHSGIDDDVLQRAFFSFYQTCSNFGLLPLVASINQQHAHQVRLQPEPYTSEGMQALMSLFTLRNQIQTYPSVREVPPELYIELVRQHVQLCRLRDSATFALVESLRAQHPEAFFVLTYGYSHRGMSSLFSHERFDINLKARGVPDFMDDAIVLSYQRLLDDPKLSVLGRLQARFEQVFDPLTVHSDAMRVFSRLGLGYCWYNHVVSVTRKQVLRDAETKK